MSSSEDDNEDDNLFGTSRNNLGITQDEKKKKKLHFCHICGKIHFSKGVLKTHMLSHSDSRPHKCSTCSKAFKTQLTLSRHMYVHKINKERYNCQVKNCDFYASTRSYLKVHHKRKHTNGFNLTCEICGKKYKIQSDLTTHLKTHNSESSICDICGKIYKNAAALYSHKHTKHGEIIKNFTCDVCKKKFKNKKNLTTHLELHKIKYKCDVCDAELKSHYGLTKHREIHLEKKFKCTVCDATFTNSSSRKVHLLKHIGERPYVCDICGQSFSQRSPMMLHRKKQHPGNLPPLPPIKITDLLHKIGEKKL